MNPISTGTGPLSADRCAHTDAAPLDERLRIVIELSSDYYWETDAEGRFTSIVHGNPKESARASQRLLGKARWETAGEPLDSSWESHRAVFRSKQPFEGFMIERAEADGSVRYLSSSGKPLFSADGTCVGYCGITKDVTKDVWERRLSDLDLALSRIFTSADSEYRTQAALELTCRTFDWECGIFWMTGDEPRKPVVRSVSCKNEKRCVCRRQATAASARETSHEWVQRACATRRMLHVPGTADNPSPSATTATTIIVPVFSRNRTLGAIEFRCRRNGRIIEQARAVLGHLAEHLANAHEQQVTLQQLTESEERYASTVELAAIGICHVDNDGKVIHANRRLLEMLGYSELDLLGMTVKELSHPNDRDVTDTMVEQLTSGQRDSFSVEKRYVRKSGEPVWVRINSVMYRDSEGKPKYHISTVEDISGRKKAEERVEFLASHDELTGLPNRTMFSELLHQAIRSARRYGTETPAILFVDLDRFKIINDSLGHEAGDALLRHVASCIRGCLRECDYVARHGGDEFVVLLDGVSESAQASDVARKIINALHKPISLNERECRISASVGIAVYPDHGTDSETLLRHADVAMYSAKQHGKNCYEFYSPDTAPMSLEHLKLEAHLRHALERNEFCLRYQPKLDTSTGQVNGVEALLRWWNHELGTISPAQFLPVAEETGLIVDIGKWALQKACEQNAAWQQAGHKPIVVSVNVSPRQFFDAGLLTDIERILERTKLSPEYLELEITEGMLVADVDRAIEIATALREKGVRLAIDDFGTGYSSLLQLRRFPLDALKIDRSFIRDLPNSAHDAAITEAIMSMAKSLGVSVVAEGIETVEQQEFLTSTLCDEIQGFLLGEPAHPDAIAGILRQESSVPRRETA